ncbi:unnamed protein product [Rangifer tarandus platyrhynchus]|uniref:Uncharacterized protein n=1 Tax=Rangifer tarandus platyrhynchus TaxID=3082113 RepID=A0AC59ZH24_RANTA
MEALAPEEQIFEEQKRERSGRDEFVKSPQMRAVVSKLEGGGREGAQDGAGAPAGDLRAGPQDTEGGG